MGHGQSIFEEVRRFSSKFRLIGGHSFVSNKKLLSGSNSIFVSTMTSTTESENVQDEQSKSALEDNIQRKGGNAYYFAHAHKATGPKWDGKAEPKLLSKQPSSVMGHKSSSFEYHKSNITKYAFLDGGKSVKLYIEMNDVGEKCTEEDVTLDFTETSLSLIVRNYKPEPQCLSFGKLTSEISEAKYRIKQDKIILILTKAKEGEWHTINDRGNADHEVV